jgi:hypothetical protein
MELNGALSNPRAALEGSLRELARLAYQLRAQPRMSQARVIRRKPAHVQSAVEEVVRSAERPVRVKDVREALQHRELGHFDSASIRKTLNRRSRGANAVFRRVGLGVYEYVE